MFKEISSKERDQAEEEAWKLMRRLTAVEKRDRDAVIKVGNDLLDLPAENVRDYELRELFEYVLFEFQSRAEEHDLWDIQAKVVLLGVRLNSPAFIRQAKLLGFKDALKVPLEEIAQAIKKDSEEADKYLPKLYDGFKRLSSD